LKFLSIYTYYLQVHANGTIFAFKDLRAQATEAYSKGLSDVKDNKRTFSSKKVLFGEDVTARLTGESGPRRPKWTQQTKTSEGETVRADEAVVTEPGNVSDDPTAAAASTAGPNSAESQQNENLDMPEEKEEKGKSFLFDKFLVIVHQASDF